MRKRYLYLLLFGIPGLFLALAGAFALFGAMAGFLWVFVFGDKPWPAAAGILLPLLTALAFLLLWGLSLALGYRTGQGYEGEPRLNRRHLALSVLFTVAPLLFLLLHQLSVGNLGPKPDSLLCAEFCRDKGLATSGLPSAAPGERTCLCYDAGEEVLRVPLEQLSGR